MFLANYADGLSDFPLPKLIHGFRQHNATAAFVAVRPHQTWHTVEIAEDGAVRNIQPISHNGTWMNGGYFVLSQRIFDVLGEGEELVAEPFRRLIDQGKLFALKYDGFWSCMDTYKDKQQLEDMVARGEAPWEVWKTTGKGVEVRGTSFLPLT
jgi:glucose-1-phosphate cytidylyltransferase